MVIYRGSLETLPEIFKKQPPPNFSIMETAQFQK